MKDPPDQGEADRHEEACESEAESDPDIAGPVKTPAEAAHEIDYRVEQVHRPPGLRQHVDRIKGATQKGERGHHQGGDDGELLEILRPNADNEAKQAERDRGEQHKGHHPAGV